MDKIDSRPPSMVPRFIRAMIGFGITVPVGLAPLLGQTKVRAFRPLLDLFPFQIQDELIRFSAFLMGLVAIAIQFYATEKLDRTILRERFWTGFLAMLGLVVLLYITYTAFVERPHIPAIGRKVAVLVGWSANKDCHCEDLARVECVAQASLNEAAIEHCWRGGQLIVAKLLVALPYLALMGGFGALVGIVLLKPREPEQPQPAPMQAEGKKTSSGKPPGKRAKAPKIPSSSDGPAPPTPRSPARKRRRTSKGDAPASPTNASTRRDDGSPS